MHRTLARSSSLLGVLLAVGCSAADTDADSEERIDEATEAVDLAAIPANQIEVAQDGSPASRQVHASR